MNIFFTVGSPPPLRFGPTVRTRLRQDVPSSGRAFWTWQWRRGSGSGFLAVRRFAAP
jgi:hypothetical protein